MSIFKTNLLRTTGTILILVLLVSLLLPFAPVSSAEIPEDTAKTQDIGNDDPVNISDPGLEAAIREALNKPSGDIYQSDLASLVSLNAANRNIFNLSGIQYCNNLTVLDLSYNEISNTTFLAFLTDLIELNLKGNDINNTVSIEGLINLKSLNLGLNLIYDIPLESLTKLESLYLNYNRIQQISSLNGLDNLSYISLAHNQIKDILPLVESTGIDSGDYIELNANPLSSQSIKSLIPQLEIRGVEVLYELSSPSIELDYESGEAGEELDITGAYYTPGYYFYVFFDKEYVKRGVIDSNGEFDKTILIPENREEGKTYTITVFASSVSNNSLEYDDVYDEKAEANFYLEKSDNDFKIELDPERGAAGEEVEVLGEDFSEDYYYYIFFDEEYLKTVTINDEGEFISSITIPEGYASNKHYTITVFASEDLKSEPEYSDSYDESAEADFYLETPSMCISLDPATGMPGDYLNLSGSGFTKNYYAYIFFDEKYLKTNITDEFGGFENTLIVPDWVDMGETCEVRVFTSKVYLSEPDYDDDFKEEARSDITIAENNQDEDIVSSPSVPPSGEIKIAYTPVLLSLNQGTSTYSWSWKADTGSSLPSGLTLKSGKEDTRTAVISGKPKRAGTYKFTVTATDKKDKTSSFNRSFEITILPALSLVYNSPPTGQCGEHYTLDFEVKGGSGPYTWSISRGTLPDRLKFEKYIGPHNQIEGTPVKDGNYRFTLTVTDDLKGTISKALTLKIRKALNIKTTTLPSGEIGVAYKTTRLKAEGGTGDYIWSSKDLPSGLTLTPDGMLKGTPVEDNLTLSGSIGDGRGDFQVYLTDGNATTGLNFSIRIYDHLLITSLPTGVAGQYYSQQLSDFTIGGSGDYKYSKVGSLPKWLKFNSKTATLYGTPSEAGTYNFKIKVKDGLKGSVTQTLTLVILAAEKFGFKFIDQYSVTDPKAIDDELLGQMVDEATDGRVKITYDHRKATDENNYLSLLNTGVYDIASIQPDLYPDQFVMENSLSWPMLGIASRNQYSDIATQLYQEGFFEGLNNYKLIAFQPDPPMNFYSRRNMSTLAYFKGYKIGYINNQLKDFISFLGAVPVNVPVEETYEDLQKGIIDSVITDYETIKKYKYYEVAKYAISDPVLIKSRFVIMSQSAWNSLPSDLKTILSQVFEEYSEAYLAGKKDADKNSIDELRDKGVQVSTFSPGDSANIKFYSNHLLQNWITKNEAKGYPAEEVINKVKELTPSVTLTLTTHDAQNSWWVRHTLRPWIDEVSIASMGRIKIKAYYDEKLVSRSEAYEAVENGSVDMAYFLPFDEPDRFKLDEINNLTTSGKTNWRPGMTYWELIQQFPEWQDEFNQVHLLSVGQEARPYLVTTNKSVSTLNDMQGVKIISEGDGSDQTLQEMGSILVSVPPDDIYEGIQKNIADGYLYSFDNFEKSNIIELLNFITRINLGNNNFAVCINSDKWNNLPDEFKEILENEGLKLTQLFDEVQVNAQNKFLDEAIKDYAIEVILPSEDEVATFEAVKTSLRDQLAVGLDTGGLPGTDVKEAFLLIEEKYSGDEYAPE